MRSSLLYFLIAMSATYAACDEGASVTSCPDGQVSCNGKCVVGAYCLPAGGTGTGGSGPAATTPTGPVDPGPFSSPDCTDSATASGTLTEAFGKMTIPVAAGGKSYHLRTNWWNERTFNGQTVTYQGLSFTAKNPKAATSPDDNPMGYPTLFIGSYDGTSGAGTNLPKQVSTITSVPTVFSTNAADLNIANHNAAYDVWFTDTPTPLAAGTYAPPLGGAYLMVWLFKPTNRQPRGTIARTAVTISGVEGTWNVWVDPKSSKSAPCISYVSTTPRNGLAFDLNGFIQDSVTHKHGLTSSMYLSIIFAGFEIWGGADGVQAKNFCAKVN